MSAVASAIRSFPGERSSEEHETIGAGQGLHEVFKAIRMVAGTDSSVLIHGETGTGKELIAGALHERSLRRRGNFVKLNCAAMPAGLIESELFGHERGAFTGAVTQTTGRFQLAHQGTLFLDEIGELPLELQPKLLRVLQEKEFERLGSTHTIRADVRVIAATNRDLEQMVEEGRFRADLYYRLSVFPIALPPLRERRQDIPLLARHFVRRFSERMDRDCSRIPDDVMKALMEYDWPGNVRELQNVIERAVILSPGPDLRLPPLSHRQQPQRAGAPLAMRTLAEAERDHIVTVLKEVNGMVGGQRGAAARLGMARTSLLYRMRKLGIGIDKAAASGASGVLV
jgi:formate hydrogenlyase transcriptional activator